MAASDIAVRLGLEGLSNVQSGIGRLGSSFAGLEGSASKLSGAFAALAPALASGLSAAAVVSWTRSTINALDAMNDLADATGSSIEKISALEEVARRNGNTLDQVSSILVRFNQALGAADGKNGVSRALQAIGVDAQELRRMDPADALREVAKALAGFADDANKARITQELFGKSIREAAPLLRDIIDAGEVQGKVSKKAAEEAERFNKQLAAMSTNASNLGRSLLIDALPAMNEFLTKLSALTREGGFWASIQREMRSNVLSDDLTRQVRIVESLTRQAAENPQDGWIAKRLKAARDNVAALQRELNGLNEAQKAWAQSVDPAAPVREPGSGRGFVNPEPAVGLPSLPDVSGSAAADAAAQAYARLISGIQQKIAVSALEKAQMEPLTDAQRQLIQVQEDARAGLLQLTAGQLAYVEQLLGSLDTSQRQVAAERDATKAIQDAARKRSDARNAEYAGIDEWERRERAARQAAIAAVEARVSQLEDEGRALTVARDRNITLAEAIEQVAIARLREKQANYTEGSEPWRAVQREIAAREKLLQTMGARRVQQESQDAADAMKRQQIDAWRDISASIEDVLTTAIIDGGEAGRDALERMFGDLVLRPMLSAILQPITGALASSLVGIPAGGSMLGSAAGSAFGSSASSGLLGSYLGGTFGAGSAFSAGMGMTASGWGGTVASLEGAGAMLAEGQIGAGLMQGLGTVMPYLAAAAAIYAIAKSLDDSGTPHMGGYALASALGTESIAEQSQGIVEPQTQRAIEAFAKGAVQLLDNTAATFGSSSRYDVQAAFEADNTDESWGFFIARELQSMRWQEGSFGATGGFAVDPAKGFKEWSQRATAAMVSTLESLDLPQWASDMLDALGDDATNEAFAQTVATMNATQRAIDGLQQAFTPLGSVLASISGLSSDAVYELGQFAGGLDALGQSVAGYVQNYYTRDEIAGIQASELMAQLQSVGLSANQLSGLSTREGYRGLVESLDAGTESGRRQLAALLNAQGTFASLSDYFGETGSTLGLTATMSPSSFQLMDTAAAQTQAADVQLQVTAINEVRDSVDDLAPILQDIAAAVRGSSSTVSINVAPAYEVQQP